MLVLTRKRQEQIRIGDNITLTILRVKGNTVRVGIDAPRDVRVVRGELPPKEMTLSLPAEVPATDFTCEDEPTEETLAEPEVVGQLVVEHDMDETILAAI